MNYLQPYPYYEDYFIQRLQTRLWESIIKPVWGCNDNNFNCFGRAYRNRFEAGNSKDKGYIPEFYDPTKRQYISGYGKNNQGGLFFEDKIAGLCYFGIVDPAKKDPNGDTVARLQLLFFVNLSRITPGGIQNAQGQRLDEICVSDIRNFIQFNGCGFVIDNIYKDVDKVLEHYSGQAKIDSLNDDMHPRFCFRVDLSLRYPANQFGGQQQRQLQPMDITPVFFIKAVPDPSKTITVGGDVLIYQEYAPTNVLVPTRVDNGQPYLAGMNTILFNYNNSTDLLADWDSDAGSWTRTGLPYGFNDGDFAGITFTDLV
jgi:hypothetical protein